MNSPPEVSAGVQTAAQGGDLSGLAQLGQDRHGQLRATLRLRAAFVASHARALPRRRQRTRERRFSLLSRAARATIAEVHEVAARRAARVERLLPKHGRSLDEHGSSEHDELADNDPVLPTDICNQSFRAAGITLHQDAGGDLEAARQIAGHASVKTTQLYNRSGDRRKHAEVERVQL